jgi:hypothetical protein
MLLSRSQLTSQIGIDPMGDIFSASIEIHSSNKLSAFQLQARLTAGSGSATGASQREIARNVVNRLRRRTMVIENTDLERRVLAHERILQVLISHMAESEPKFLDRLKAIFTRHHTLGADEQNFTGTEQYAEQFIRQIEILVERKKH